MYNLLTMANYEIEIKSLLGDQAAADALVTKMQSVDPNMKVVGKNSQLNHYFVGGDLKQLYSLLENLFNDEQKKKFNDFLEHGSDFSVRTRDKDGEVLLVMKAALDGGTSANTVSRLEFEESLPIAIKELDDLLLQAGFEFQAKWSRSRVEYAYKDVTVCLDKNAGYGYLAEFETVTTNQEELPAVKAKLEKCMAELGVVELDQERLARMFAHYNEFWPDYYGTDKTFNIE